MSVNLLFKIAAVGILVSVLGQVLKHSGREEQAYLASLAGLVLVLFWVLPYISQLFESIKELGVPQNDLGIRTDLLDCCPKAEGMMMLIRSMSPEVVAVDEIGDYGDIKAIESVLNCGCRLIATVHGSSVEDIEKKPLLQKMVKEHVFDRYIILSGKKKIGSVWGIFDGRGTRLYGEEGVVC